MACKLGSLLAIKSGRDGEANGVEVHGRGRGGLCGYGDLKRGLSPIVLVVPLLKNQLDADPFRWSLRPVLFLRLRALWFTPLG